MERPVASSSTSQSRPLSRLLHDGTVQIVLGTLVAGVAAYIYQIAGGRVLGAEDFAPVSVLLTLHFIAFIVVLIPVEQLVIRAVTLGTIGDRRVRRDVIVVVTAAVAAQTLIAVVWRERLFDGDWTLVFAAAVTVLTHAGFVVGRGFLAGSARYRGYGAVSGAAGLLRLVVAVVVLIVAPSAAGLALALVVGPLVIAVWRPHRRIAAEEAAADSPGSFLAGVILASGASQILLLSGPVVAAFVGASAVEVSILFGTLTILRAPLTFGYNLLARVLPPFTRMAAAGDDASLRRWGLGIFAGGTSLAVLAGLAAYWAGPWVIAVSFGEDFRPESALAGLIAAGVVLSAAALLAGEILVARARTGRLAAAWTASLVVAALALIIVGDGPQGVAIAFVVGEAAALLAIGGATVGTDAGPA